MMCTETLYFIEHKKSYCDPSSKNSTELIPTRVSRALEIGINPKYAATCLALLKDLAEKTNHDKQLHRFKEPLKISAYY